MARSGGKLLPSYTVDGRQDRMEAAATGDEQGFARSVLCEAAFFLAEAPLLRHRKTEAVPLLRRARETCPATSIEYQAAATELKRLVR